MFSPACNPSLCIAKGRGLQPKGLRIKETAEFKVYTKGAGTGDLKVTIKGPSKWMPYSFAVFIHSVRALSINLRYSTGVLRASYPTTKCFTQRVLRSPVRRRIWEMACTALTITLPHLGITSSRSHGVDNTSHAGK